MSKLIPKFQSPWTPINYKPTKNSEEVRVTNKQETHKPRSKEWTYRSKYNPVYTVGDTLERTPEYKLEINPQTGRPYTVQEKDLPLSGTDPVGEFIVAGEVLGGLSPLGKILFPYAARFTSGSVRNWIASKALNDVLAKDALTGGVNKVVLNNGNILLQLASHSARKPRLLRIEPQGNNSFRVHASTWGGLTDTEKKLLYESLYKELPENAKILFPESNPDYLATRGTVAGLLRLKRDPRFTPGSTILKLMYKDKDGSIKFFEGTGFTKNSELQPKTIFRTIGYKGGNIKDKYSAFFTTDPRYAKQYGKVQKYLIESDNFNVAGEPLIGTKDPVGMDMFIYQNTRNNPNSRLIIGHDVVTDEFPYLSKGTEMLSLSPNNYTAIKVNKPKTSLSFFENPSKITPEQWTAFEATPKITHFYHGSPVRFDIFDAQYIGSGEGGSKVMKGINLWPEEKIANAPKFANIKSSDAPLHLGVSSTPLGGELNPTIYDVSGKGLKLYKATPREIKSLNQEDLIKQGYDGVQTSNQVTVFPESINKLSIDKQSSIEDFVMSHPEVERWTPWTTDTQKMQNIIDISKMSKWTPEQWTAAQDAAIARGDMVEAQRLRDLHFKISAPNTQIKNTQYHGAKGNAKFNVFDPKLIGQTDKGWAGKGYYFTPSIDYAKMYGSEPRAFYINAQNVHDGATAAYFGRENGPEASAFKIIRKRHGNDGQKILDELASSDAIRTSFSQTQPYNGRFEEVVTRNNNQMKLADAVTYDDNGVRIPLGKRDNFNVNDIRYGLVPWLLGGTTAGYLYNNK